MREMSLSRRFGWAYREWELPPTRIFIRFAEEAEIFRQNSVSTRFNSIQTETHRRSGVSLPSLPILIVKFHQESGVGTPSYKNFYPFCIRGNLNRVVALNMRIITGKFKGTRLIPIKGNTIRPTSDRVKEALFSILRERIIDANFLDLCAGTGGIGLEALSRGAKSATFIESDYRCTRLIASNLEQCGLHQRHPQVRLMRLDARKALATLGQRKVQFDLVYCDPPYDSDIYESCLRQSGTDKILSEMGLIVVEHRRTQAMPLTIDRFAQTRQERYGDTVLSFYEWAECDSRETDT